MNPVRESRSGVVSVIAALGAVALFWLIYLPRTEAYKTYRVEADLKKTLAAIQPPEGAKIVSVDYQHVGPASFVMGIYVSDSKLETLRTHYMQEFIRRGFVFKGEDNAQTQTTLRFCRPGYDAALVFSKAKIETVVFYTIQIYRSGKAC